ncbi:MAG: hypothetical protein N4A35_16945 [Flavobacteriales bacterium]|jgi:hypothetical protein|nr:hypothetical protein [Flavobacteriales bacterium]
MESQKTQSETVIRFKWFDKHPAKSIILYTITIGVVTWGIFGFLLDDRKENLHKTEIELLNFKLDSNKVIEGQLLARVDFLEKENMTLREQNYKYYEWISNSPKTLAYLEKENSSMRKKISKLKENEADQLIEDSSKVETVHEKYHINSNRLEKGEAFIDELTGASLCVTDISFLNDVDGHYNLPNSSQKDFYNLKPGISWGFKDKGREYKIYLQEIDYPTGTYKVMLREQ